MLHAIISGDLIAYTALENHEKAKLEQLLQELLNDLREKYQVFGRIVRGDFIECYVPRMEHSLRIALAIKSKLKTAPLFLKQKRGKSASARSAFVQHGIREAIGIGELKRLDLDKGIIDGDIIYHTGRLLDEQKTYDRKKITIRESMYFHSPNSSLNALMLPMMRLIHERITPCTAKQTEVLYLKLLGARESSIQETLGRAQSTINRHSTQAGWYAIESAVIWFEKHLQDFLSDPTPS